MMKATSNLILLMLFCSMLIPAQVNVASAAEDYELAVKLPSGAYIHIYYEDNWSETQKSVITEQLMTFLPLMSEKFWAIRHNASVTIKLKDDGPYHGWGQILYDTQEEIVGYTGWIEIPPMNMNGVLEIILHELTHVFQFWVPNYWKVTGNHIEAVALAFSRALIVEQFGWNTAQDTDLTTRLTARGQLVFPYQSGAAVYLKGWTGSFASYDINKGWKELWYYDPYVFKKYNLFVASLPSETEIGLRDAISVALFEDSPDHSYDGYPVDDWLDGFSFFNSLFDIPEGERMLDWQGYNSRSPLSGESMISFEAGVYMRQGGIVVEIPVSTFDITIKDGQTGELLYSKVSQPGSHDWVNYIGIGEIPSRNLLRIDVFAHLSDGEDVSATGYLARKTGGTVVDERAAFFLNREGYAEGVGSSNVGPIDDGYVKWRAVNDVEATVTWSGGTYTYVIGNIIADPALGFHQMAIRLYESRTFISPLAQIMDIDETTQLTAYISPKVSSGNVTIYHSMDKENWTPIANVTPTDGYATYEYAPSQIGQHYFKASWTGDGIIDPSQSSVARIDVAENRATSFTSINASVTSSQIGFKVNLSGTLHGEAGASLANAIVNLYRVCNGTEMPLTIVATDDAGCYNFSWTPDALGCYTVIAEWDGNLTYVGASNNVTLAFLESVDQNVFTVESNSSISEFNYDVTDTSLSFTVNGSDGTGGYAKVTIPKNIVADIANLKVYVDSYEVEFSVAETDDSWTITFDYLHSSHEVVMDLNVTIIPEFSFSYILILLMVAVSLAVMLQKNGK
jgi:hypothetical protein